MKLAHMVYQRLHGPTQGIHIPKLITQDTRILSVRSMTFDHEALPKDELARLEDVFLVPLFGYEDRGPLADLPEVVSSGGDADAAAWTATFTSGCEVGC